MFELEKQLQQASVMNIVSASLSGKDITELSSEKITEIINKAREISQKIYSND